jgi:hypothetical protein
MYDHQTESLWLQVKRKAVAGPMTGTKLEKLASTITSWEKWRKRFPHTKVLSLNTGYTRDYSKDPYADYYKTKKGFFSFLKPGPGAEEKELIIGIEISGIAKGYRLEMLREKKEIRDKILDKTIVLSYDDETNSVKVKDQEGKVIDFILTYWMVWDGIYPETQVYDE